MRKPRNNLIGKRYGRLVVTELTDSSYHQSRVWKCLCDCGVACYVDTSRLGCGNTRSCGCLGKETRISISNKVRKEIGVAAFNRLYDRYKRGAQRRDYIFELTTEQFKDLVSKDCDYCGVSPKQSYMGNKFCNGAIIYNGIDRVDNNIGYTITNSVTCCKLCNVAKHELTLVEFEDWIKRVYEYRNLR